jgi:prepilin-type N-terminal cleavage/methylation domain-containing protein
MRNPNNAPTICRIPEEFELICPRHVNRDKAPRHVFQRTDRIPRGFTLLEVIVALGIFALGSVAVLMLYFNSLKTAKQGKDEMTLTLLARDIRDKVQLAALNAFKGSPAASTFATSDWLLRDPAAADDPGAPVKLDGGGGGGTPDSVALNGQAWSEIVKRYDAIGGAGGKWTDNPLYQNFQFRLRTVLPPEVDSNQFVDWDGYDIWDASTRKLLPNIHADEADDNSGEPRRHLPLEVPEAARGADPAGVAHTGSRFGPPRPSHGISLDPRGLRHYIKHLQCVIGWDLGKSGDIFSGQHHTFQFTVYNPDAHKRP